MYELSITFATKNILQFLKGNFSSNMDSLQSDYRHFIIWRGNYLTVIGWKQTNLCDYSAVQRNAGALVFYLVIW